MAKSIAKKNTSKKVNHTATISVAGEQVVLKATTAKNCVGNPILEDPKCQACWNHKTSDCGMICLVMAGYNEPKEVNNVLGDIRIREAVVNKRVDGKYEGKVQNRVVGKRGKKNEWGHFENTIGSCLDDLIAIGTYTRKELAELAGTKASKVNSHINHLRKDKGAEIASPRGGKVSFVEANA